MEGRPESRPGDRSDRRPNADSPPNPNWTDRPTLLRHPSPIRPSAECLFATRSHLDRRRKVDSHADGNQTRGGSNITFRYNNIYMPVSGTPEYPGSPYKSNATFMLQLNISNFVIENNWLNGGNYTIYCPDNGGVSVRNNIFGRYNGGWKDSKDHLRTHAGSCDQWSGNTWEDTGGPI